MDTKTTIKEKTGLTVEEVKKRIAAKVQEAKLDPAIFIDKFCYTFNPKQEPYHLPFVLFDFQKNILIPEVKNAIDKGYDILIEKCREMGATYTVLDVLLWFWLNVEGSNFLLGSRKEDYVDSTKGNSSEASNKEESLFGKLEYTLNRLPAFMLPKGFNINKHMTYMSLLNPENGNVISGESANPNFSRGGRMKAILLDEFAFWDNDCYNKDMEALTQKGWKLIKDITKDDLVYSMNPKTQEAEYMPVIDTQKVFTEDLISFKSKSADIIVTSNHKMLVSKRYQTSNKRNFLYKEIAEKPKGTNTNGQMYFRRADELFTQKHDLIPLTSKYIKGEQPERIFGFVAKDWMEFLGWFVSEGYSSNKIGRKRIGISQSETANKDNCEQIKRLLKRMGLPVNYYNNQAFQIRMGAFSKEAFDELCSLGKADQKYIPQKYLNLSKELIEPMFDSLIKGDGCEIKRKNRVNKLSYATTSKRLADNVQEIAQKIGLRGSITLVDDSKKHPNWKPRFIINIGFKKNAQITALKKEIIKYNDYAYCVTTPYHTLYVRRNGIACWCGNSSAWGSTADTTNCRIVLTTPGIKPSKAKRLRFGKDGETIRVITLPYHLDPRKDLQWLNNQRERRSEEDFAREVLINWEQSIQGILYPEIKYAELSSFPFNPSWSLYRSWDFGLDGTAIQWWQRNPNNGKFRLIDSYYNEGHPIQFYFPFVGEPIDSQYIYTTEDLETIKVVGKFSKAINFGDPDVGKRSYATKDKTSTRKVLEDINIYVQTNTVDNNNHVRQEKTKILLQRGIEVNITPRNEFWLEALTQARLPQRKEGAETTTENTKPIHDWTSHHRTATEYFAINFKESVIPLMHNNHPEEIKVSSLDPYR